MPMLSSRSPRRAGHIGRGRHNPLAGNGNLAVLGALVISAALFGMTGTGLGALLGSEVPTIAGPLLYQYVAEPLISHIAALHTWMAYLPTGSPRPARPVYGYCHPGRAAWCSPPGPSRSPPRAPWSPPAATSPDVTAGMTTGRDWNARCSLPRRPAPARLACSNVLDVARPTRASVDAVLSGGRQASVRGIHAGRRSPSTPWPSTSPAPGPSEACAASGRICSSLRSRSASSAVRMPMCETAQGSRRRRRSCATAD